jgi:hypothetical protein
MRRKIDWEEILVARKTIKRKPKRENSSKELSESIIRLRGLEGRAKKLKQKLIGLKSKSKFRWGWRIWLEDLKVKKDWFFY